MGRSIVHIRDAFYVPHTNDMGVSFLRGTYTVPFIRCHFGNLEIGLNSATKTDGQI